MIHNLFRRLLFVCVLLLGETFWLSFCYENIWGIISGIVFLIALTAITLAAINDY